MLRLCLLQAVVLDLERDARKLADAGGIFVTPTVVSRLKYRYYASQLTSDRCGVTGDVERKNI